MEAPPARTAEPITANSVRNIPPLPLMLAFPSERPPSAGIHLDNGREGISILPIRCAWRAPAADPIAGLATKRDLTGSSPIKGC
jgi:hypothetical protein